MHITHALGHRLPARWRLTATTLVIASCVTFALAIGGTASSSAAGVATASVAASPVIQPNLPIATTSAATTESFHAMSPVPPWRYIGHYFWKSDCLETGANGQRGGLWRYYQCINGSASPFNDYELWVMS